MYLFIYALAQGQTEAAPVQGQGSFMALLPMYLIIFFVFYIFLLRPQQKKQQDHLSMIAKLKKNDEVITSGGIHGTIVNVKDKTVVLRVDDNVKIEVEKSAIAAVEKSRQE